MITDYVTNKVCSSEREYIKFMKLETFPSYELQTKEVSLAIADKQGFDSIARTLYSPNSNSHTLIISTNMPIPDYILFHEFTHILDDELHAKGDKTRYAELSGFTEYHAAQVELMRMLNAEYVDAVFSFSMNTQIETVSGQKSVLQYINDKYQHACDLFSRSDFPANIETLKSALGIVYNYLGLRSICEMYSIDYTETNNYSAFLKYIPSFLFAILNSNMHGWLTSAQIETCCATYSYIIIPIIKEYKLA